MQQGCVEQRGVLQEGEVACVGQDQQSGSGDSGGDVFRVCALDRLVVIAVSHQRRDADRLQLGVCPVRLSLPHLADLRDEGVVVLRCRRQSGVFVPGALDEGGEGGVPFHALLHT